jgi:hypothetical protein
MQMNYKFVYQQTITVAWRDVIGHQQAQHVCTLICCLRPCFLKQPTCLPVLLSVTLKQMKGPPTMLRKHAAYYKIVLYKMRQMTSLCSA